MKKLLIFVLPFLLMACTAELESKYDDLDKRVSNLEAYCNNLNNDIASLKTIVNSLQSKDYVTGVTPIRIGGEVTGYNITFEKSGAISIYNGEKGTDGKDGSTPVIGIKADADGVLYWTINGEWLKNSSGEKVPATGPQGNTPKLKIEDGYWYITYDDNSWQQIGKAQGEPGDSMFSKVDNSNPDYLILTLVNGEEIILNKKSAFNITFNLNGNEYAIIGEEFKPISYTITGATNEASVTIMGDGNYTGKTARTSNASGTITISATDSSVDGFIHVIAADLDGHYCVKMISIYKSRLELPDGLTYTIPSKGNTIKIPIRTNSQYEIEMDPTASWVTREAETKAMMRTDYLTLIIAQNKGGERVANIKIYNTDNGSKTLAHTIVITQSESSVSDWVSCYVNSVSYSSLGGYKNINFKFNVSNESTENITLTGLVVMDSNKKVLKRFNFAADVSVVSAGETLSYGIPISGTYEDFFYFDLTFTAKGKEYTKTCSYLIPQYNF